MGQASRDTGADGKTQPAIARAGNRPNLHRFGRASEYRARQPKGGHILGNTATPWDARRSPPIRFGPIDRHGGPRL